MSKLTWESWLQLEGCIKSEGAVALWFICPTAEEDKWNLARVWKETDFYIPKNIGIFLSIHEAMDTAQNLENITVTDVEWEGPSIASSVG